MILIHIPHSSINVPKEFRDQFIIDDSELNKEVRLMADLFVDRLVENIDEEKIIFPISRIVCDVERFRDDKDEEMARQGMGVVYTKRHDLGPLRKKGVDAEKIKSDLYDKHHAVFESKVNNMLENYGKCFIIDLHSYSDRPLAYELHPKEKRPDICLGFDEFHIDRELVERIKQLCELAGYEVSYNEPFKGSIVPLSAYRKDKRIRSLMIEINKRTYLKGFQSVPERFEKLKQLISDLIAEIKDFYK